MADEKLNLYNNVKYAVTVINRGKISSQVKKAGTLPFMQLQGASNYCGVCAINNLLGREAVSIKYVNNVADDLWLRQIEQCEIPLTENIQCHRDVDGFFSFHTIEAVLESYNYTLSLISANNVLMATVQRQNYSSLIQELASHYGTPTKLLILDTESEHYTAVIIEKSTVWCLDSKKRTPITVRERKFVKSLKEKTTYIYCLQHRVTEVNLCWYCV